MLIRTTIAATLTLAALAAGVRAGNMTIDQSGQQFSQKSVDLTVGGEIKFVNSDDVTHNINIVNEDDDAEDLGLQKPGETITYKFDKAGKIRVRCSIHPGMKMTVNVK